MAFLPLFGHVISVIMLMIGASFIRFADWLTRFFVSCVMFLTGAELPNDKRKWGPQREINSDLVYEPKDKPEIGILNREESLKNSKFPLDPERVEFLTKQLASPDAAFGSKNPDLLADDFQFIFPIVGPLNKTEFCTIFGGFGLKDAFPDSRANYFGFTVDPLEPNRCWFFARGQYKHTGPLKFGKEVFQPTGKEVINTPQVLSMSFDREGRCYKFTGGYSIDKTIGNCGGLGGVFGIIHAIKPGSIPFPEAKPWKPSLEWEAFAKHVPEAQFHWTGKRSTEPRSSNKL